MNIIKLYNDKKESASDASSAGDVIGSNEDLIRGILIYVRQDKSLCRLKLVSKFWLYIIADHGFSMAWRTKNIASPSGLLMVSHRDFFSYKTEKFIGLDEHTEFSHGLNFDLKSLPFKKDDNKRLLIKLVQCCNGLLLVSRSREYVMELTDLAIFNPTTNQFKIISTIHKDHDILHRAMLAFDPYKSPHYKVILVVVRKKEPTQTYVFDSELDSWRVAECGNCSLMLQLGVYWNDGIQWSRTCRYLDIKNLCYKFMARPPFLDKEYFGESGGHLLCIERPTLAMQFDIFELKLDRSMWFVKYNVNLTALRLQFPNPKFCVLAVVFDQDQVNESAKLVLRLVETVDASQRKMQINTKVISYNLQTETVKDVGHLSEDPLDSYMAVWPFTRLPFTLL